MAILARSSRARLDWHRLRRLHRHQGGAAQSLSFVLTLPLFVALMIFIIQLAQLMMATIVVHYAAFAAAHSAIVWIPSRLDALIEPENCIGTWQRHPDMRLPHDEPSALEPTPGGMTYLVYYGTATGPLPTPPHAFSRGSVLTPLPSLKCQKILEAMLMALTPIGPSARVAPGGGSAGGAWQSDLADTMTDAFGRLVPNPYADPSAIARRMRSKMNYVAANAALELRFYHPNTSSHPESYPYPDAPLHRWDLEPDRDEFRALAADSGTEIGWQDPITATVYYNLPLMPGPARFLAWLIRSPLDFPRELLRNGACPLKASVTLVNEGEKPVIPYLENPPDVATSN